MSKPVVPRPGPVVRWIVRDSGVNGELHGWVSVWTERPARYPLGDGFVWLSPGRERLDGHEGALWLAEAAKKFGTVPDDDRQCVRVERRS